MDRDIQSDLAEISAHMQAVAQATDPGEHMNEVAHAVHNLVLCVEDLADRVARLSP